MPSYTGRCKTCGEFDDLMKASEYIRAGGLQCPICKEMAVTVIRSAPAIIGPLPSKPLNIEQIGQSFSSAAEQRAYFEKRPDRVLVGPNDSAFRDFRDDAHNQADKKARVLGFRDHEDRRAYARKDNAQRKAIKSGDKKIQVTT